jgi:predicted Zn-dependent peptidase
LKLANGLRVVLLSDPELPLWHCSLIAAAGSAADPPGHLGLAETTARVLIRTGTRDLDPAKINSVVFRSGVHLQASNEFSLSTISLHGPSAASPGVFAAVSDEIMKPLFRRGVLESVLRAAPPGDSSRGADLAAAAEREFLAAFLNSGEGGAPVSLPIFTEDLARLHEQWWNPGNLALVLAGDFEIPAMARKIESDWGDWRAAAANMPPARRQIALKSPQVVLTSLENTPESSIVLGAWLARLTLAEEAAVQLFAQLLEERIAGEKKPDRPAPGAGVSAGPVGDQGRPFRLFANVPVRETVDEVRRLQKLTEEVRSGALSPEQWNAAKRLVLERFAARFDRPWKAAEFAAGSLLLNRAEDYPLKFHSAVASLSPADFSGIVKALFAPEKFVISIAGDERDFRHPAASLGLPVRKAAGSGGRPESAPASGDAASARKGAEALDKMREAMGGLERIEGITDGEWTYNVTVFAGAGASLDQRVRWLRSGVLRHDEKSPEALTALYYDGKTAWRWRHQRKEPLPRVIANQYAGELFRTPYTLALSDRVEGRTVHYIGSDVLRISGGQDLSVEVALDEVTHLPETFRYSGVSTTGKPVLVEERFSNYRNAGGILVPGRIDMYEAGRLIANFELTGIKFNSGLNPEELATITIR